MGMPEPKLVHRGKVREVYRWNDKLLLVASDRVSAFDVILPTPIPDKGAVLTRISQFWFDRFSRSIGLEHHALSFDLPAGLPPEWAGRTTICLPATPVKMECVVRGYLAGSAWNDYKQTGAVQGHTLPPGLLESSRLPRPIFTPSTKADAGHDEPLTETEGRLLVGDDLYCRLEELSLRIYHDARAYAESRGILIADTKFEFGHDAEGRLLLIDEVLTPDSSRFWPAADYQPGRSQNSYDKQFVRDYLLGLSGWNRQPPGPSLPTDIVARTRAKYLEACELLTGHPLAQAATGYTES